MIGSTISHYRVIEELGRGGMGVVYKATDSRLDRTVALKFLPPEKIKSEKGRSRLISEARAASSLNHPNILTIHDIDEFDDKLYIVMEYLEGLSLQERIAKGPLTIPEIVEIAYQIAVGLRVAHDHDIIHRDVKPGNVMLVDSDRVKLMDFGLAKHSGGKSLTEDGQTVGTAAYMSPEQIQGEKVDKRTDIWSFGVVLYELLLGERPFQEDYLPAIIYSVLNEEAPDPLEINPDLPPSLVAMVAKCLVKDPVERYTDMAEVLAELDSFLSKSGISLSSDIKSQYRRSRRTHPVLVAAALLLIAAVVALSFPSVRHWIFSSGEEPPTAPRRIAMLPLAMISGEEFDQSVSDGLLASLTNQLGGMQRFESTLSVIPASQVLSKGIIDVMRADSLFDVDLVVESTFTRVGDNINLLLSLIDVARISIVRTITLRASVSNLLAFQDEAVPAFLSLLDIDASRIANSDIVVGGTSVPHAFNLYLKGQGYLQRFTVESNIDEAIRLLEEAAVADPRYALAHAGLGEAYWKKYDLTKENSWVDKANASAHFAKGISDDLAPVHVTLGLTYTKRGNHEDGDAAYNRALELEPNNVAALIGLGDSFSSQRKDEEAEDLLSRAIELQPGYWLGYNRLGIHYYNRDRDEDAIEQWLRVIELAPDVGRGFNNLSSASGRLGLRDDEIRYLEQAIDVEPENPMFYRNLAAIKYFDGYYTEAARLLEDVVELSPSEFRSWSQLANAYYWAPGERSGAINAWNQTIRHANDALRVNPNDSYALDFLASALSNVGRFDEAMSAVRSLQDLGELSATNCQTISQVFEQSGIRDSALFYIRLAFQKDIDPNAILSPPWLEDLKSDERFAEIAAEFVTPD